MALSGTPDDPNRTVTPGPRSPQSDHEQDGEKIGAALLFSGLFLSLFGTTCTILGWLNYQESLTFEWTQLLGPVLLSVGGTFILTSVCKFGLLSCLPCRHWEEEVATPAMEQTTTGQSFVFNAINHPIMFHGSTAVLCIPPPYNFVTREVNPANGPPSRPPRYDAVCCVDNAALSAESSLPQNVHADWRRSR